MLTYRMLPIVIVLLIVCSSFVVPVFAGGFTEYSTVPVSPQIATDFLTGIEFRSANKISEGQMIISFDISEQGKVALAIETPSETQIGVYDSRGNFVYGYSFIKGSAVVIFFEGERLAINWAKSGYIASFDDQGGCVRFEKDDGSRKNADLFHNQRFRPHSGSVGSLKYRTDGPWFTWRCWLLAVEDINGNQTVIYDASQSQSILWPLGIFGCIVFFVLLIYRTIKKEKND